jgi:hypothetical protein
MLLAIIHSILYSLIQFGARPIMITLAGFEIANPVIINLVVVGLRLWNTFTALPVADIAEHSPIAKNVQKGWQILQNLFSRPLIPAGLAELFDESSQMSARLAQPLNLPDGRYERPRSPFPSREDRSIQAQPLLTRELASAVSMMHNLAALLRRHMQSLIAGRRGMVFFEVLPNCQVSG